MASHVGSFEINPLSYNLQDWEFKWFADHGCVAGIIFMNYWLSQIDSGLGLKYIERTLNHIVNVCGTDVAAIGLILMVLLTHQTNWLTCRSYQELLPTLKGWI